MCRAHQRAARRSQVLLHALRHYALRVEIIFNLAVSTQTTKPPNLIPCQFFRLYGTLYIQLYYDGKVSKTCCACMLVQYKLRVGYGEAAYNAGLLEIHLAVTLRRSPI